MKRKLSVILLLLVFTGTTHLLAQEKKKRCGTTEYMARLRAEDPALDERLKESELNIQRLSRQSQSMRSAAVNTIITIPVVFHVIYRFPSQNISQARLDDQILTLNNDFARLNADSVDTPLPWRSLAANTGIQFCLAKQDPNGNATTGIIRVPTTVNGFDPKSNQNVKHTATGGDDPWPTKKYLNVWLCDFTGNSNDILGVSQFPNGDTTTDGCCVLSSTVGGANFHGNEPGYNLGRTLTHEVGHWLGMYHVWADDSYGDTLCQNSGPPGQCYYSDAVGDTPNQGIENYGCPTFPMFDCCSGSTMVGNPGDPVNGVMFMNYMDYVDDKCMNLFTQGQSARMHQQITSYRPGILTSAGCLIPLGISSVNSQILDLSVYPNPASGIVQLSGTFANESDAVITISNMVGEIVFMEELKRKGDFLLPVDLSAKAEGIYNLTVRTATGLVNKKIVLTR